ncbi:hypothetical protein Ancab_037423 [Ancistrocladus abbreviatus]
MGSCISKCRPKKECSSNPVPVQDKLVISHTQNSLPPLSPSTCSASSSYSFSSSSSTSTTTASSSCSSLSSASSCASSISTSSKDRSFSNDFLLSCIKENQHIIQVDDLIRIGLLTTLPTKDDHANSKLNLAAAAKQQPSQQKLVRSAANKRPRASSPNLTRQKSFKKENERSISTYSVSSGNLRSPSASRRFINGDMSIIAQERSGSRRFLAAKANGVNSLKKEILRENLRPPSPRNNSRRYHRETCINRVASKIDETAIGQLLPNQDVDSMPMEDIDNPLIALDCFIFL